MSLGEVLPPLGDLSVLSCRRGELREHTSWWQREHGALGRAGVLVGILLPILMRRGATTKSIVMCFDYTIHYLL